ncbi:MAG: glycosyltransferase family 2 protein [Candidatus Zixiibacteriota bacterium]
MKQLTVIVITKNEIANIKRCLTSVSWADEIIVVDSHSSDGTPDVATSMGARVISRDWDGYGPTKQAALDLASGEWVLSIDADEEVSAELRAQIQGKIANPDDCAGYSMPRLTSFLGRWIYHCGWYPDPVLRLFRREKGRFDSVQVHEKVIVDGKVGKLTGNVLHYSYPDLDSYFLKFNRYTTMGAEQLASSRIRAGLGDLTIRPVIAFIKHYISKRGFLDGAEGFLVSVFSSMAVMVKYAKLRHLNKSRDRQQ